MNQDLKKIVVSEEQIKNRLKTIGEMIDEKYKNEPIMLIGLLKGAFIFTADVSRNIKNPNTEIELMVVKSYKNGESSKNIEIVLDLKKEVKNKNIILIEDIVETGKTLSKIKKLILYRGAKNVEIAAMCIKNQKLITDVKIDYPAFQLGDGIVVGYGLDYNEKYRHLPYIATITKETYKKYKIK